MNARTDDASARTSTDGAQNVSAFQPSILTAQECSESAPTLARIVSAMKSDVMRLIRIGQVPQGTTKFSQLHDYCDANCLGGLEDDDVFDILVQHFGGRNEDDGIPDGLHQLLDAAMREIDMWLATGRESHTT